MELKNKTAPPQAGEHIAQIPTELVEDSLEPVERPLPGSLRYAMLGLLLVGVVGVIGFGYIRQTSIKPPAQATNPNNCKDPVTENRLRETVQQSPNDFATLMDWGAYNFACDKNYPAAVAAYQRAYELSVQLNTAVQPMERTEARFRLGLAHLYNQNMTEAENHFKGIVSDEPENVSALFALGAMLVNQNPAQASLYLRKVIDLEPGTEFAKQAQSVLDTLKPPAKP